MVGTGGSAAAPSSSSRAVPVDRFYSPPHVRRQQLEQQQKQQQQQQLPRSPPSPQRTARPKSAQRPAAPAPPPPQADPDARAELEEEASSKPSVSPSASLPPTLAPAGNLDRFLSFTTPKVLARHLPKRIGRGRRGEDSTDSSLYYCLEDLWESFAEWSVYGAGVPLMLNGTELVVQYYVPFLSAIQIFADPLRQTARSRRPGTGSDEQANVDTRSEGSSENEAERFRERGVSQGTAVRTENGSIQSDGEAFAAASLPVFEYLEREPPYGREPLADKVSILARKFPDLQSLRSNDLHPSSWMSVAWYPIYRIPTGPTLKDLDACFLTFHKLATPSASSNTSSTSYAPPGTKSINGCTDGQGNMLLPAFGLASYKYRSTVWNSSGTGASDEPQLASSLLKEADAWLQLRKVDHPDFRWFFLHSNSTWR